jgi:hypothetical protein
MTIRCVRCDAAPARRSHCLVDSCGTSNVRQRGVETVRTTHQDLRCRSASRDAHDPVRGVGSACSIPGLMMRCGTIIEYVLSIVGDDYPTDLATGYPHIYPAFADSPATYRLAHTANREFVLTKTNGPMRHTAISGRHIMSM